MTGTTSSKYVEPSPNNGHMIPRVPVQGQGHSNSASEQRSATGEGADIYIDIYIYIHVLIVRDTYSKWHL